MKKQVHGARLTVQDEKGRRQRTEGRGLILGGEKAEKR
jgi:hypothetical protein